LAHYFLELDLLGIKHEVSGAARPIDLVFIHHFQQLIGLHEFPHGMEMRVGNWKLHGLFDSQHRRDVNVLAWGRAKPSY
jgi:hypothetical protein